MKAVENHDPEERDGLSTGKSIRDYLASHKSGIGSLISGQFEIQSLEQAEKLSTMLASHYPSPERVSTGIWELMSNAVEHGNLEIDFELKSKLIHRGEYSEEIVRRLALPRYAERAVSVEFKRTKKTIRLRVTDQGPGFDYNKYIAQEFSLDGPNGRGILIATKFSFDKVIYRGRGNVVDALVRL